MAFKRDGHVLFAAALSTLSGCVRSSPDDASIGPALDRAPPAATAEALPRRRPGALLASPEERLRTDAQERLLAIAGEYARWPNVVGYGVWGPADCADPHIARKLANDGPSADGLRKSISHGDGLKLAYYYALDRQDYTKTDGALPRVGQTVVKEAWSPEPVTDQQALGIPVITAPDGKKYRPGHRTGLFVMYRLDPGAQGTDEGWVYGTMTADGKHVTSAGAIESCVTCHKNAGPGRLFGVK
jgi:hypothetical protein